MAPADVDSSVDFHQLVQAHQAVAAWLPPLEEIRTLLDRSTSLLFLRFHLLAEFDDVKRSCRKRLAGHNERRRKPQLENHSARIVSASGHFCTQILKVELSNQTPLFILDKSEWSATHFLFNLSNRLCSQLLQPSQV